ncbi:MAG: hypothetical protein GF313_06460 [Caldithrix sp.]|nr:hypothetical protein [Caldithrix sp.]
MKSLQIVIAGLLLFVAAPAFAQLEYEISTFYQAGYENNIFHSPTSYIDRDGTVFNEDALVQSDVLNEFGWDAELERELNDKHRFRLENSGWLRRYSTVKSAKQAVFDLELKYDFDLNRRIDLGGEIWGSNSNKLGTNVLGEELTLTFAYKEIGTEGYFESELWDDAFGIIEMGWRYRNYQSDPGVESLTYSEASVLAEFIQEFGSRDREQYIALEVEFEDKPYRERTSNDSTGYFGDPTYPSRHWQYLSGQISYGLEINNRWKFEPFFELTHRADLFQSYYDYRKTEYGIKITRDTGRLDVVGGVYYQDRLYLVRTAPQETGVDPLLNYRYFRFAFDLEYELLDNLIIMGEYSTKLRRTNVTVETMRTRRSYDYFDFTLGLEYGIEGLFGR